MIVRSTKNHKPAKKIKVKRRAYEEIVADRARYASLLQKSDPPTEIRNQAPELWQDQS